MRKNGNHIIQKITLDIFTNSKETGNLMEREASTFFYQKILPHLEAYFDELEAQLGKQTMEIPRLSLDLQFETDDFFSEANFERPIRMAMNEIIGELPELRSSVESFAYRYQENGEATSPGNINEPFPKEKIEKGPQLRQKDERFFEAWLHFLQTGLLPWWLESQLAKERFQLVFLVSELKNIRKWKSFLYILQFPQVRHRLISQYSVSELSAVLWEVLKDCGTLEKPTIEGILERFPSKERNLPVGILIALAFDHLKMTEETKKMTQWFGDNLSQESKSRLKNAILPLISTEDKRVWGTFFEKVVFGGHDPEFVPEKQPFRQIELDEIEKQVNFQEEGHYVDCAGLILIHPFLKAFFADCGFLDEKGKLLEKELAVLSLYYLANREENPFDFELLFEKYLCGIPLQIPIAREIKLPDIIKEKTEKLLGSLLEHWEKLKSTGKDTVRNEFINRRGKLVIQSSADHLNVERKPQDILLESLPWNLSLVKLPWHSKLILVEW
ncbi:contractile injection system tape measure protein [Cyclobacterium jeungdonense]|uniref:Contractile injection system tape measure protein n=1 Tax=Cyclobacterium jeungdonense TaxID=708087 RepID=A0ABT8CD15_9BACT|nr:contractile injection system tape measure protein [Cyclobacterium jeungdonense]MDN3689967.1 contractile injection system tape measure protein [Cyclobacterium jeungdonense]